MQHVSKVYMLELCACGAFLLQAMRLFAAFTKHAPLFQEFKLPTHVRLMLILLSIAPIVLMWHNPISLAIGAACWAPCWYIAHAQYHVLDAQGTAQVKPAQSWLASVEMLSMISGIYWALQLCITTFVFIISR